MARFVVRPCDNDGTVEGLKRDRTWDVHDLDGRGCVSMHITRVAARKEAAEWSALDDGLRALAAFAAKGARR